MAKQKTNPEETISSKIKQLSDLKVKRSVEQTKEYDKQITSLEEEIDYFNFGVKTK